MAKGYESSMIHLYHNKALFSLVYIISAHDLSESEILCHRILTALHVRHHPTESPQAFGNIPAIKALSVNIYTPVTLKCSRCGWTNIFWVSNFWAMKIDMLQPLAWDVSSVSQPIICCICNVRLGGKVQVSCRSTENLVDSQTDKHISVWEARKTNAVLCALSYLI